MSIPIVIRSRQPGDAVWATHVLTSAWGGTRVVTRGQVHDAAELPGLVATTRHVETDAPLAMGVGLPEEPVGLLTYRIAGNELEIVTLNSVRERVGVGIGTALVTAAIEIARGSGCRRVWLITTNDNLPALRFYQRRGFRLSALYPDALAASRRLKPEIPLEGRDGIALRDELELEFPL
jgi:ribosomal protein S18 acetylase RimI-like enzyme